MNIDLKNRVIAWFNTHRCKIIEDIKVLVSIPSVATESQEETPYGEACKQALYAYINIAERMGFKTNNYENHCGAAWLEHKNKTIGLWCHLDVVPEGCGWAFDPYRPIYQNGLLIGRGADDNKGPAIGMLYVLRCIKDLGLKTNYGLKVFFGCHEEAGMRDIDYYLNRYPAPDMSIVPDCNFPVCHGEKGIIEAEILSARHFNADVLAMSGGTTSNVVPDIASITLKASKDVMERLVHLPDSIQVKLVNDIVTLSAVGVSCHAAFPHGGVNAIHELMKALLEAQMLEEDRDIISFLCRVNDDTFGTALNIRMKDEISGDLTCVGSLLSLREGRICLGLNIRYCISARGSDLVKNITKVCTENQCEFQCHRDSAPSHFPKEHPIVQTLTGIYNKYTGNNAKPYVMAGGTYARKLPNAIGFGLGGLPKHKNLLLRPGHGAPHGPDEALDVENFFEALMIFTLGLVEADRLLDSL